MIDGSTVTENEHGLVRLFVVLRPADMERGQTFALETLAAMLGVPALGAADVQQIWTDDLVDMSLQELLMSGYGVMPEDIERHAETIDATMDMHPTLYIIIRSSAFVDRPVTLADTGPAHLLATLREPDANVAFEPLPNPDPAAVLEDPPQKKRPSDAVMSGRVAMIALIVMALLVWVMIRIAG
jgi:hypothetical protein